MQVKNQVLHALALKGLDGRLEFVHGGLGKPTDLDVADLFVDHVRGIDAVDGNFVPNDVEGQQTRFAFALDAHLNHSSLGAFEQFHDVPVGDANARRVFPVHFHNAVACTNAQALGGAAADGRHDHDGVLEDVELHADALKIPVQWFVGFFEFVGREVHRVGVQILQHLHNGQFRQILHTHAVHVQLPDVAHEGPKFLSSLLRGHVVLGKGLQRIQNQQSRSEERKGEAWNRHGCVNLRDAEGRWR